MTGSARTTEVDVVVMTDLRFSGGTSSSLAEELLAASAAGYTTGIVHLRSSRLGRTATVHPRLAGLIGDGVSRLVLPGERVDAALAIVKHPSIFVESLGGRLPLMTERVIVTAGQVPADDAGDYYDPVDVARHIEEACGRTAIWHPVSPVVRDSLARFPSPAAVPLSDDDWSEIIDVHAWSEAAVRSVDVSRPSPDAGVAADDEQVADARLVIGRHSRPDPQKWPDDPEVLRAIYPTDGSVVVRVLGGPPPADVVPTDELDAWEVLPYGAMPPAEFLAGLDAFVYYHAPQMVEAFGRTVLEALAVGVPTVLPPHFRPVFGDACRYAAPEDALSVVQAMVNDPLAAVAQVEQANEVVRQRFSHGAHADRLRALTGGPRDRAVGPPAPGIGNLTAAPPGVRAASPVVVVSAIGLDAAGIERLLFALDAHRRRPAGFSPVVVISATRPPLVEQLGIETKVITSRRRWDDPAESWEAYATRRLRQIASSYGAEGVVPADVDHPDAWIALQHPVPR